MLRLVKTYKSFTSLPITGDGNKSPPPNKAPPLRLDSWLAKLVQILKIFKIFLWAGPAGPAEGRIRAQTGLTGGGVFPSRVIDAKGVPNWPKGDPEKGCSSLRTSHHHNSDASSNMKMGKRQESMN